MLSRKLMHDEVREALMKAKSYEEVINAFEK
jgi:mannitol/fructose-specific phosphotransferase system IIA component (Ntr-type)